MRASDNFKPIQTDTFAKKKRNAHKIFAQTLMRHHTPHTHTHRHLSLMVFLYISTGAHIHLCTIARSRTREHRAHHHTFITGRARPPDDTCNFLDIYMQIIMSSRTSQRAMRVCESFAPKCVRRAFALIQKHRSREFAFSL